MGAVNERCEWVWGMDAKHVREGGSRPACRPPEDTSHAEPRVRVSLCGGQTTANEKDCRTLGSKSPIRSLWVISRPSTATSLSPGRSPLSIPGSDRARGQGHATLNRTARRGTKEREREGGCSRVGCSGVTLCTGAAARAPLACARFARCSRCGGRPLHRADLWCPLVVVLDGDAQRSLPGGDGRRSTKIPSPIRWQSGGERTARYWYACSRWVAFSVSTVAASRSIMTVSHVSEGGAAAPPPSHRDPPVALGLGVGGGWTAGAMAPLLSTSRAFHCVSFSPPPPLSSRVTDSTLTAVTGCDAPRETLVGTCHIWVRTELCAGHLPNVGFDPTQPMRHEGIAAGHD